MEYFKIKSILTAHDDMCKVEIITEHGEQEGKYGPQFVYDVKVGDEMMKWYATENQHKNIKEVGCNPFLIKRWDAGTKTGFNFLQPDDITAQPQNNKPEQMINPAKNEDFQKAKDERDIAIRIGAAVHYAARQFEAIPESEVDKKLMKSRVKNVIEMAKMFYEEVTSWNEALLDWAEEEVPLGKEDKVEEKEKPITDTDGSPLPF